MSMRNLMDDPRRGCARAFSIVGFFGREVYRQAPPIPERMA
jgi:nitric oxide reductase large subunit